MNCTTTTLDKSKFFQQFTCLTVLGVIFVFSGPVLPDQFKKTFAFKGCGNCCQLKKQLVGGLIGNPLETVFETFYDSLRTLLDLLLETLWKSFTNP